MSAPSAGRVAFEAYTDAVGGSTHDGKPIPMWEDLTDAVRAGWEAAAAAVAWGIEYGQVAMPPPLPR